MASLPENRFSVVIPVFNHEAKVVDVVREALRLKFPVFVVDDGSTDSTGVKLEKIQGVHLLRHRVNKGKGAAIITGFKEAVRQSCWAITLDADGQHNPLDAKHLIKAVPHDQRPIVIGRRKGMDDSHVHWTSRYGREFSNFWVALSGGPKIADTQSGFRLYPLPEALNLDVKARRFQFEVEILVKAVWRGIPVREVPIGVDYHPGHGRISHFRPFIDFVRNTRTFSRLIVQRIFIPQSIRRRF